MLGWSDQQLQAVITEMKTAPALMQQQLAKSVAQNKLGFEALLKAMEQGMLSIQLLRDKQLVEQLNALQIKGGNKRLQRLIAMAPTVNKNHQKLITQRKTAYFTKPGDIARGRLAFTTYCASSVSYTHLTLPTICSV